MSFLSIENRVANKEIKKRLFGNVRGSQEPTFITNMRECYDTFLSIQELKGHGKKLSHLPGGNVNKLVKQHHRDEQGPFLTRFKQNSQIFV